MQIIIKISSPAGCVVRTLTLVQRSIVLCNEIISYSGVPLASFSQRFRQRALVGSCVVRGSRGMIRTQLLNMRLVAGVHLFRTPLVGLGELAVALGCRNGFRLEFHLVLSE